MPKSWRVLASMWLFCAVPDFERTGICFPSLICPWIVRMCNMLSVNKILKISVVHVPAYLANFSERISERKLLHFGLFFYSRPDFIDHIQFSEIQDVFYSSVKPSKHVKKLYLIG